MGCNDVPSCCFFLEASRQIRVWFSKEIQDFLDNIDGWVDGAKGGILLTWLIPIDLLDFDSIFNQTATLLLMAEIWRSPVEVGSTIYPSIYSFFFTHPRWCRISSINSTIQNLWSISFVSYVSFNITSHYIIF